MKRILGGMLGTWSETNSTVTVTRNSDYFNLKRTNSKTTACHGGLTTSFKIDLTKYAKMHMVINSSTHSVFPQYVTATGKQSATSTNEKNQLAEWVAVTEDEGPVHYEVDISNITASYYPGLWIKGGVTEEFNIAAWYLEEIEESE